MPKVRLLPLTQEQKILQRQMKKEGLVVATGVRLDSGTEKFYAAQLIDYIERMEESINRELLSQLVVREPEYTTDGFITDFRQILENMQQQWGLAASQASILASNVVSKEDKTERDRLQESMRGALGVDVVNIVNGEGLNNAIESAVAYNTNLITSIPEQYLSKISDVVLSETVKGRTATSMIEQIQHIGDVTKNRARLIARDQTNKINGDLTRERQTASGIRAFRWRTVGDEAVRESHRRRNGKIYAWRPEDVGKKIKVGNKTVTLLDPNADGIGYPGEEIQCRCIAEAIIEL